MKLDATLDDVQNSRFRNIYHDLKKQMIKQFALNEIDLDCILLIYHKFVLVNGKRAKYMTRDQLSQIFHILFQMDTNLTDRIVMAIDPDSKNFVSPKAWIKLIAVYLIGSLEEKIDFCFKVYDINGNQKLTRAVVKRFVKHFLVSDFYEDADEIINDMVDMIIRRMDIDRDGVISFEDYAKTVRKNPTLLEFLGRCIPSSMSVVCFIRPLQEIKRRT